MSSLKNTSWLVAATIVSMVLLACLVWKIEYWRLQNRLQTRIALQAADLDRDLSQLSVLPRLLSSDPRLISALLSPGQNNIQAANETLAHAKTVGNVAFAFLMDTSGITIASSNWQSQVSFIGQNYQFRPYFSGALTGKKTTFFAVGATTGVPGYFIAEPVRNDDEIIGVAVVKMELNKLLDSWQENTFLSLLIDELNVVILSTEPALLYVATTEPSPQSIATIGKDRRYKLNTNARLEAVPSSFWTTQNWRWTGIATNRSYTTVATTLATEPWTIRNLVSLASVALNAALYFTFLVGAIAIAALVTRNYRQNRLFAESQERQAQLLELLVKRRTHELKSAQKALIAQSNFAMLGRMSAAINHEINQPLASLRFNFATLRLLLKSADSNSDEIRTTIIDSDRTTKRIGRVIETLRNVARQNSTIFTTIDVRHLITEVAAVVIRERPVASDALLLQPQDEKPAPNNAAIRGNEVLMQQALLNLLYNAFDATLNTKNPEVLFYTKQHEQSVLLVVQDNGEGVSSELVNELYTPFLTDTTRQGGLGLGLVLAKQIVEDHSGTLSYEPVTTGGSKFTARIPIDRSSTNHE